MFKGVNRIYEYKQVYREKNIHQTIGNFSKIYEEVMQIQNIEISKEEYETLDVQTIKISPCEAFCRTSIDDIVFFRTFIFNRYEMNHDELQVKKNESYELYPKVILIKRGSRIQLIDDAELKKVNNNITTGKERREIKDIEKVEDFLHLFSFKTPIFTAKK